MTNFQNRAIVVHGNDGILKSCAVSAVMMIFFIVPRRHARLDRASREKTDNTKQGSESGLTPTPLDLGTATVPAKKQPWPKSLPEQVQALRAQLETADTALTPEQLARRFTRGQKKRVGELLETLVALGQAHSEDEGSTYRS